MGSGSIKSEVSSNGFSLIGSRGNGGGGGVTSLFSVGRKLSRSIVVISSLILVIPLDLDLDCKFCNSISSSSTTTSSSE